MSRFRDRFRGRFRPRFRDRFRASGGGDPVFIFLGTIGGGQVRKVDGGGNIIWAMTDGAPAVTAIACNPSGESWAASADQGIQRINADGVRQWTTDTGAATGVAVDENANSWVADESGGASDPRLARLLSEGSVDWQSNDGLDLNAIAYHDGFVYVANGRAGDGLKKYDAFTGSLEWESTDNVCRGDIAVDPDLGVVYVGTTSGDVRKYDISDGSEITAGNWPISPSSDWILGMELDADGNLYFGGRDDNIYSYDSAGALRWTFTGHTGDVEGVAVSTTGHVYTASRDDTFKKLDADDGTEITSGNWPLTGLGDAFSVAVTPGTISAFPDEWT